MLRSHETVGRGTFEPHDVIDSVTLDLDARRKRRQMLECEGGLCFLVDLPAVPTLKDGDGFRLESGPVIAVRAASEPLIEVRAGADMARIAWHLGNRHLLVQFAGDALRLRTDHVIEAMLEQLGASVRHLEAPFDPEGGAYGHGHTQSHD